MNYNYVYDEKEEKFQSDVTQTISKGQIIIAINTKQEFADHLEKIGSAIRDDTETLHVTIKYDKPGVLEMFLIPLHIRNDIQQDYEFIYR